LKVGTNVLGNRRDVRRVLVDPMLKWFNVDGHLAKSKIKKSEVPNERKRKQNKVHKGIQS